MNRENVTIAEDMNDDSTSMRQHQAHNTTSVVCPQPDSSVWSVIRSFRLINTNLQIKSSDVGQGTCVDFIELPAPWHDVSRYYSDTEQARHCAILVCRR